MVQAESVIGLVCPAILQRVLYVREGSSLPRAREPKIYDATPAASRALPPHQATSPSGVNSISRSPQTSDLSGGISDQEATYGAGAIQCVPSYQGKSLTARHTRPRKSTCILENGSASCWPSRIWSEMCRSVTRADHGAEGAIDTVQWFSMLPDHNARMW